MTEDQIIQLVNNTVQNSTQKSQFGVANVPYHTHNGTDSPYIASQQASGSFMTTTVYDPASITEQIVGINAAQTVANKTFTSSTFTSPVINNPTVKASIQTVTTLTGTTPTIDCSTANIFSITLSGNTTYSISNVTPGQCFMVEVKQGSGTTYTNTWFTTITWVVLGSVAPVQTTVSNGYTTYAFRCTGTNTYLGYLAGTQT